MSVFIGIDGGGTSTRFLIEDRGATRMVEAKTSIMFLRDGYERAASILEVLLREELGDRFASIGAIAIGLAGAGREDEQREFELAIRTHFAIPNLRLTVESDSTMTLKGALPEGAAGILLIVGTGSVAIGRDSAGSMTRVGGWGRLMGDEGSGHAIGLAALRHFARVVDGRELPGPLFATIQDAFSDWIDADPRKLRSLVEGGKVQPASLAELVFQTRSLESERILDEAVREASELVETAARKLPQARQLVLHGSIARSDRFRSHFEHFAATHGLKISLLNENAALEAALREAKMPGA